MRCGKTALAGKRAPTAHPGQIAILRHMRNPPIRAALAFFGVRKICRSRLAGERGEPGHECVAERSPSRASALPQLIRGKSRFFGICEIRRSGQHRHFSAYAKSVGAGLLANAVSQATNALRPGLQQIAPVGFKTRGGRGTFCIQRPKKSPREEGFLFSSQREVLLSAYSTTLGSHSEIAGI